MCDEEDISENPGPIKDVNQCPVCWAPISSDDLCECILM